MGTIKANTIQPLTGSDPLVLKTNDSERLRILTSGNIGIGTSTPSTLLDVNGTVKSTAMYCTGNVGIGTAIPSAALVALDVAGIVKNTNPVFEVTASFRHAIASTTSGKEVNLELKCDTKLIDTAGAYDTTTGRFTAPVSGAYFFSCNMRFMVAGDVNSNQYGLIYFQRDGSRASEIFLTPNPGANNYINYASVTGTVVFYLSAGSWVSVVYRGMPYLNDSVNFNGYFMG